MRKIKLLIVFVFLFLCFNTVSAFTTGFSFEIPVYKTFESPKGGGLGFYIHFTPDKDSFFKYYIKGLWRLTESDSLLFELNNFFGVKLGNPLGIFPLIGGATMGMLFMEDKQLLSYGIFLTMDAYIYEYDGGTMGFGFRMLNEYLNFYGYEFYFMMNFRFL